MRDHPSKPNGRKKQRFIVALPDEIAEQIRMLARVGPRPINTQFEILLELALRQEDSAAA